MKRRKSGFSIMEAVIAIALILTVTLTAISIVSLADNATDADLAQLEAKRAADNALACFKYTNSQDEFENVMATALNVGMTSTELSSEVINVEGACSICGRVDSSADTHVHQLEYLERVEPTCSEVGRVECYQCVFCDKFFSDEEGKNQISSVILDKIGHTPDIASPSCYQAVVCTECGVILEPSTPHKYVNGVCEYCKAINPNADPSVFEQEVKIEKSYNKSFCYDFKNSNGRNCTLEIANAPLSSSQIVPSDFGACAVRNVKFVGDSRNRNVTYMTAETKVGYDKTLSTSNIDVPYVAYCVGDENDNVLKDLSVTVYVKTSSRKSTRIRVSFGGYETHYSYYQSGVYLSKTLPENNEKINFNSTNYKSGLTTNANNGNNYSSGEVIYLNDEIKALNTSKVYIIIPLLIGQDGSDDGVQFYGVDIVSNNIRYDYHYDLADTGRKEAQATFSRDDVNNSARNLSVSASLIGAASVHNVFLDSEVENKGTSIRPNYVSKGKSFLTCQYNGIEKQLLLYRYAESFFENDGRIKNNADAPYVAYKVDAGKNRILDSLKVYINYISMRDFQYAIYVTDKLPSGKLDTTKCQFIGTHTSTDGESRTKDFDEDRSAAMDYYLSEDQLKALGDCQTLYVVVALCNYNYSLLEQGSTLSRYLSKESTRADYAMLTGVSIRATTADVITTGKTDITYVDHICSTGSLVHVAAKEPSCAEDGNCAYCYCSLCGKYYREPEGNEAKTHKLIDGDEKSFLYYFDSYERMLMPKSGHIAGSMWLGDGSQHWRKCIVCGAIFNIGSHQSAVATKNSSEYEYKISFADGYDLKVTACFLTGEFEATVTKQSDGSVIYSLPFTKG